MMNKVVIAGASELDNIEGFLHSTLDFNIEFILIENEFMFKHIPLEHHKYVIKTEEFEYKGEVFLPLNEYWVSLAIEYQVSNISEQALLASRSKFYLSKVLSEQGLSCVKRYFIDDIPHGYINKYLARVDTGYSSYGVISYKQLGQYDKQKIIKAVNSSVSNSMQNILNVKSNQIVVEDFIEGDEYSVDVYVDQNTVKILRLCHKNIKWINGKPVCESYITIPFQGGLASVITKWCNALFGSSSQCFGQFDFIVTDKGPLAIDFSCRIGGGLRALKQFTQKNSYIFNAMFSSSNYFSSYFCQKNLFSNQSGQIVSIDYSIPTDCMIWIEKNVGDRLHHNLSSSNAKIAALCFQAESFDEAIERSQNLTSKVSINVQ